MKSLPVVLASAALATLGCAPPRPIDYDLVTTDIKPFEYAQVICYGLPMDVRHTCMTRAMGHYRERARLGGPPSEATEGPFAMVFSDGDFYTGRYGSDPFSLSFTVRNSENGSTCRGSYSAYQGDTEPTFRIRCDQGATGEGRVIIDLGGRNGLGEFTMNDGRRGRIAFGYAAVDMTGENI